MLSAALMADTTEASTTTTPAKKGSAKSKLLIALVIVFAMSAAGAGTYAWTLSQRAAAPAPKSSARGGHADHGADAADDGPAEGDEEEDAERTIGLTLALDPLVTNLDEPENGRFVKVTMHLELRGGEEAKAVVERGLVAIRHALLMRLSALKVADTAGQAKREALQVELTRLANQAIGGRRIKRVFFGEFVVQ